jgi:hypothetical protein
LKIGIAARHCEVDVFYGRNNAYTPPTQAKSTPSPMAALRGPQKQMQCIVAPKWHQLESSSMLLPHYKSMKSIYQTLNSLAE